MSAPGVERGNAERPGVVTAVAILCWLVGTVELILSVLLIVLAAIRGILPASETGDILVSTIGYLIVAVAYIAVGFGVFRGVDLARVIVLLASVVHLGVGLYTALTTQPVAGILSMGLAVAIALPLWVGRGAAWFGGDRPTTPPSS
ncbi:hypothetical protein [Leifsonia shinshuensis]|uniref:Integral membrane protein n=1 Tax=Leifsonia shinshuensis TaxID=150026 RepID=A0A853CXP2_9MICO|nr:hypothetical protein [Leifsonia shinshuensis]NYJ23560.1 hypothetical protein [Leifsonia shinshuensis]